MKSTSAEQVPFSLKRIINGTCAVSAITLSGLTPLSTGLVLTGPADAYATELAQNDIIISDCEGMTRAQVQGEPAIMTHTLKVSLKKDSPVPASLTLTAADGKKSEQTVAEGKATFANLHPGSYQLCDQDKVSSFSSITLEPAEASDDSLLGGVVAGAAVLGGTALAMNAGSDGSGTSNSGSQALLDAEPAAQPGTVSGKPATAPARSPKRDDRDCLNGAKVNPISPFD